jgi:large subunit ribosomal protein L29
MKAKDIRDFSDEELVVKQKEFKKDLFALNNQKRIGAVEKPSRFKALKRDIARIMTVLKERERENAGNSGKKN